MSLLKNCRNGFTLIELMISLAIGSIVISAGLTLYAQMSKSTSLVRAESLLQENAYFIRQVIQQYINQAGYRPAKKTTLIATLLPIDYKEKAFPEVTGKWKSGEYIHTDDDGLSIRFMGASNDTGSADGSIVNCQRAAIDESTVVELSIKVENGTLLCNSAGADVVLVDEKDGLNIEQYVISFGVDTNNDQNVDKYMDATSATSMDDPILAIRWSFLLSSLNNVLSESADYTFNGSAYTSSDKRLRHETSIWLDLKN